MERERFDKARRKEIEDARPEFDRAMAVLEEKRSKHRSKGQQKGAKKTAPPHK